MTIKTLWQHTRTAFIVLTLLAWVFSGWPQVGNFPPKIQETQAIECGFGTDIGGGVCRGFLTTTGSNQTFTSPADWNNSNNEIEVIGAGGGGGGGSSRASGGGAGAYSLITNFSFATPGTTTATYRVGAGGGSGAAGGDTWFNDTAFPGAGTDTTKVAAKGGGAGAGAASGTASGGAGGVDTDGWGATRRSGGNGGDSSNNCSTGGGGAAGDVAAGGNAGACTGVNVATNGGQANGSGAAGGTGSSGGGAHTGGNGGNGTEWSTEGSGGGGGAARSTNGGTTTGGNGGARGGGGGGASSSGTATGGSGIQGVIVITYTPAAANPTFTLNDYRWYVDNDSENVSDPWGVPDIAENTAITPIPVGNDPPSSSQELRLRGNFTVNTANLSASSQQFKLQFKAGTDGSCTSGTWTDIGAVASSAWQFASSSVTDGTTLTVLKLAASDVLEVYAKANPTVTNPNSATTGQDIEYDFHIIGSGSDFASATQYSFRAVESDGTVFDGYTTCPTLTTEPGTGNLMRHGNFFSSGSEQGFFWAD